MAQDATRTPSTAVRGTLEIEEKFELDAPGVPDAVRARPAGTIALDATYYDTDDLRLLAAGITLRRRRGGADAGWHLKVPAHGGRFELWADGGTSTAVPSELAALVTARTRGKRLGRVAEIHTTRTTFVADRGGAPAAEIAVDDVVATTPAGEQRWTELEVEALPGRAPAARRIAAALARSGLRRAPAPSKLARTLGDPRRRAPRGLIATRIAALAEELATHDLEVRRGLEESVHDMRVTCRRLRGCLTTFEPFVADGGAAAAAELRWIAGVLGAARDLEVLGARVDDAVASLGTADAATLTPLFAEELARRSERATRDLHVALSSARYLSLLEALDALAVTGLRPARRGPVVHAAERALREATRRLDAAIAQKGQRRDAAFHRARRAAKRARYAAETVTPLVGEDAARAARRFASVQELLGDRQDAVVAETFFTALSRGAVPASPAAPRTDSVRHAALAALGAAEHRRVEAADAAIGRLRRRLPRDLH